MSFLSGEAPDFNPGEHTFRPAQKAQAREGLQPRPCAQWHSHSWLCACGVRAVHLPPPSPLRGMKLCVIGFSLCVFPVGGSPGFQSGGARLQACAKRAVTAAKSTRLQPLRAWLFSCHADSSAPALRPVAQPFLAVRLWSAGSPLTASFAARHCSSFSRHSPLVTVRHSRRSAQWPKACHPLLLLDLCATRLKE